MGRREASYTLQLPKTSSPSAVAAEADGRRGSELITEVSRAQGLDPVASAAAELELAGDRFRVFVMLASCEQLPPATGAKRA